MILVTTTSALAGLLEYPLLKLWIDSSLHGFLGSLVISLLPQNHGILENISIIECAQGDERIQVSLLEMYYEIETMHDFFIQICLFLYVPWDYFRIFF